MRYRSFLNTDPPGLAEVWNDAVTGRGAVVLGSNSLLEHFVFAKLYFDPEGFVVAEDEHGLVGFAHAAFGPRPDGAAVQPQDGVVCLVAVSTSYRRRGVGGELLRRSEEYLRGRGAQTITAGGMSPVNPFYFGLYGGAAAPGVLESSRSAGPFLHKYGYAVDRTCLVLQRRIDAPLNLGDGRFAALRRRFDVKGRPQPRMRNWWEANVLGPVEVTEFCLEEKTTGQIAAVASVWEMEPYAPSWNESAIGILNVEVRPELRRQGLAKFLLTQTFRYLQDQFYSVVEVQVPADHDAARNLFQNLGLTQVDVGHSYRKA